MNTTAIPLLDPAIRVETTDHGTRYILPNRELGKARIFGLFLIAFGLGDLGFMGFWFISFAGLLDPGWQFDLNHLIRPCIAAVFSFPLFLSGVIPLVLGVGMLSVNHTELTITPTQIRRKEIGGPFHWTFKYKISKIRTIRVSQSSNPKSSAIKNIAALILEGDFKRPRPVAFAYPRALLIPLAQALAAHCVPSDPMSILQLGNSASDSTPAPSVQIDPETPDPSSTSDSIPDNAPELVPPQPSNSKIVLVQESGMTTLAIPRPGLKSTWSGLLLFGIVWTPLWAFAAFMIVAHPEKNQGSLLLPGMLTGGCSLLGLGMIFGAINAMCTKSVIIATTDQLIFNKASLLGKKDLQWDRTNLTTILVGPSNTSVNDKPLMQLQIKTQDGKTKGLFTGREDRELAWLAAILRQALALKQ